MTSEETPKSVSGANSSPTAPVVIAFGMPREQVDFAKRNSGFLRHYTELMDTVDKVFARTFNFLSQDEFDRMSALPESDEERLRLEYSLLVRKITYYMARSASEDFHDIVLLAANGKGIGAQKILRGMYERTVTAEFIAANPEEAQPFVDEFDIQQWNILNRVLKSAPEEASQKFTETEIQEFHDRSKRAQAKRKLSLCPKCGQAYLQAGWTPVNLNDMAVRLANGLDLLYTVCYVIPSALHHPHRLDCRCK